MSDTIQHTLDYMPCRLCLGKFGHHSWQTCPARCVDCNGYGHTLGPNHPAGHIDSHHHLFHDTLRDSICETCHGSGILPRFQEELKLYRTQLEAMLRTKATQPIE